MASETLNFIFYTTTNLVDFGPVSWYLAFSPETALLSTTQVPCTGGASIFVVGGLVQQVYTFCEHSIAVEILNLSTCFRVSPEPNLVYTFKLVVCLVFLSAIRGGVPRYRYDFLTKLG